MFLKSLITLACILDTRTSALVCNQLQGSATRISSNLKVSREAIVLLHLTDSESQMRRSDCVKAQSDQRI